MCGILKVVYAYWGILKGDVCTIVIYMCIAHGGGY